MADAQAQNGPITWAMLQRVFADHRDWETAKFEAIGERFISMDKALILAASEAAKQYHSLNELRKEVTTDRADFVLRDTHETQQTDYERRFEDIVERVVRLESAHLASVASQARQIQVWGLFLMALSIGIGFLFHLLK